MFFFSLSLFLTKRCEKTAIISCCQRGKRKTKKRRKGGKEERKGGKERIKGGKGKGKSPGKKERENMKIV
jgi:hypothetical protein